MLQTHLLAGFRRCARLAFSCYAWLVFVLVMLTFGSAIAMLGRPQWGRPVARAAARLMFRLAGMPISIEGLERLPQTPHILLVNHTSFLDGLVLSALLPARPGYAFVVKQQHRSQALLWPLLKGLGTVLLSRAEPGHRTENVKTLAAVLGRGHRLVVFPEGGIEPEAGLKQFHSGTFIAAAYTHVPVVVAGLHGARTALRLGTWLPHRAPICLRIGPRLMPSGRDRLAILQLIRASRRAMTPLTGERDDA